MIADGPRFNFDEADDIGLEVHVSDECCAEFRLKVIWKSRRNELKHLQAIGAFQEAAATCQQHVKKVAADVRRLWMNGFSRRNLSLVTSAATKERFLKRAASAPSAHQS
jgi:hypothetical protein